MSSSWSRSRQGRVVFAHRFSLQFDFESVVEQAVEQGVSDRRFSNVFMPAGDGELTGDQSGAAGMTLFYDFEKIMAFALK